MTIKTTNKREFRIDSSSLFQLQLIRWCAKERAIALHAALHLKDFQLATSLCAI